MKAKKLMTFLLSTVLILQTFSLGVYAEDDGGTGNKGTQDITNQVVETGDGQVVESRVETKGVGAGNRSVVAESGEGTQVSET